MELTSLILSILAAGSLDKGIPTPRVSKWEEMIANVITQVSGLITDYGDINVTQLSIVTGEQEFGGLNLTVTDGILTGLGDFVGEDISAPGLIPTKINVTIHFKNVSLHDFNYNLDGTLDFPFSEEPLPLTGNGGLLFNFLDLRVTAYVTITANTTGMFVKTLDMTASLANITLDLENLMGGGDLGWAFNTVLNDVGGVAFDYYMPVLLDGVHDAIVLIMDFILDQIFGQHFTNLVTCT